MTFLAILLALVASCSNAASNVVQRITNREEAGVRTLSMRLILHLLHRPLWFAGLGAVTLSFLLQASALRFGPLSLVEPLLACELPLTFVGAALFLRARLGPREWGAAAVMTAGLVGLIAFLDPRGATHAGLPPLGWALGLCASLGAVAALVVSGWRARGDLRAAFYGAATGIEFGLTAALMKGAMNALGSGIGPLFSAWQTYAMVVAGIGGMFLVQNAMQSGKILAAQPGITLLDPFVAIAWGIFGFRERTADGNLHLALAATGGALMVAGGLLLSGSPILARGRESGTGRATTAPRARGASKPAEAPESRRRASRAHKRLTNLEEG
ncbi:MAG: DMT family transporter [Acidimicrobiales bacterium]